MKKKNMLKKIFICIAFLYVIYILLSQQKSINQYSKEKAEYEKLLSSELEHHNELLTEKENVNSKEYVENVAREKLDMYLPNERVYIDVSK